MSRLLNSVRGERHRKIGYVLRLDVLDDRAVRAADDQGDTEPAA